MLYYLVKGIAPGNSPTLFNNTTCSENHSMLFQCINLHNIGIYDCENDTAGVICEMPSPMPMTTSVSVFMSKLNDNFGNVIITQSIDFF